MACSVTLGTPLRVEGPRTKAEGWGTDLVPVPQPFGEQARMLGGGTRPRVPRFRAHDETVAIAHGVEARPIAAVLMDDP
jgi:hypothetical protein